MQFAELVLATGETEFAGQASHAAEPVAFLNFPVTHARHSVSSAALVWPIMHLQSVLALLPAGDSEFGVQSVQAALLAAVLKVLGAHKLHDNGTCDCEFLTNTIAPDILLS